MGGGHKIMGGHQNYGVANHLCVHIYEETLP